MRGYDILKDIRTLTPEQQDQFLQHLLGKMSMDLEGFTDSPSRHEHMYAKYVFDNMDDSLTRTRLGVTARPLTVCDKHGVHMTDTCQLCMYEANHPPIEPKGSYELGPEQLQEMHRQQLMPTADSIENTAQPPEKPVYHDCPKCHARLIQKAAPGMATDFWYCPDCGHVPILLNEIDPEDAAIDMNPTMSAVSTPPEKTASCVVCSMPVYPHEKSICCSVCLNNWSDINKSLKPATEMIDGLLVSTDALAYHLIPTIAIERLCERIMLGEKTKGKDAWNALSDNQHVLDSKKALARRFGHGINHAYRLLGKLQRGEAWTEEDEREASAVMWAGMYAICAIHQQTKCQL